MESFFRIITGKTKIIFKPPQLKGFQKQIHLVLALNL